MNGDGQDRPIKRRPGVGSRNGCSWHGQTTAIDSSELICIYANEPTLEKPPTAKSRMPFELSEFRRFARGAAAMQNVDKK